MRLIKLKLKDFRRFSGEHSLDLNEDLLALVGPNEAGKTSLLYAIDLLGRRSRPLPTDVTRGQAGPASVSGLYALDDADRAIIESIHGGSKVSHVWVELRSGSDPTTWLFEPYPNRDLEPRRRTTELLAAIENDPAL